MFIFSFYFIIMLFGYDLFKFESKYKLLIGVIVLAIIILVNYINRLDKEKNLDKKIVISLMIVGIGFLFTAIYIKNITYFLYAFIFCILFPLFYYNTTKASLNNIFHGISNGCIISFIVFVICSILAAPLTSSQYCSITGNPNALGDYIVAVICSIIFLIDKYGENKLLYVCFGISIALMIFSRSRTCTISVVIIFFIWIIYIFLLRKYDFKHILTKCLKMVVISIVMFFVMFFILYNVTPKIVSFNEEYLNIPRIDTEFSDELIDGELEIEDMCNLYLNRTEKGIVSGSRFSSGRTEIWNYYCERTEFWGHKNEMIFKQKNGGFLNAHNTYLQLWYSAGLIAFVGFCLFTVMIIWSALKKTKKLYKNKNFDSRYLFVIIISFGFAMRILVSSIYSPFLYILVFMFWIVTPFYVIED